MLKTKWKVVLVGIIKNEEDYIEEWIVYHLSIGIDHFFLYDNGSNDDTLAKVAKFANAGVLTYIFWPMRGGQIDAYNHATKLLHDSAEWVGFLDADEFFVPHEHDDVHAFLTDSGADQVVIPWRNFPHSGHAVRPGGTTIENYFWAYRIPQDQVVQVKHFVKLSHIEKVYPHFSSMTSGTIVVADGSPGRFTHAIANPTYKRAQINHYATKSAAENSIRLQKGQVSGSAHKRPDAFHPLTADVAARHDYDDSILRHFERYAKEDLLWRSSPDFPHRYGLAQRSVVLSSWNDVQYYFAKSFGNYLIGETLVQATTKFTFLRPEHEGNSTNIGGFLLGYGRPVLSFIVAHNGVSHYFQGSIHYADFVRRYGYRCLQMKREAVEETLSFSVSIPKICGLFIMFDITAGARTILTVAPQTGEPVISEFPAGRVAGSAYLPTCPEGRLTAAVTGATVVREFVVGLLP